MSNMELQEIAPRRNDRVALRRSMAVAALLACTISAGCAEHNPVGLTPVVRKDVIGGLSNTFFVGWASSYSDNPIHTQPNSGPDSRQYRQYIAYGASQGTLDFAAANPGKLYINGDEPDTQPACISPYDYAGSYHDFVAAIRSYDPSAQFSPAGFSESNQDCCPPGGSPCPDKHSTNYAQQFYDSYVTRYGIAPPVSEWRFHDFGDWLIAGDVTGWWSRVSGLASWSVAHGANMALGSWGFLGWNQVNFPSYTLSSFLGDMKQAMALVLNDTRINQAAWWSLQNTGYWHFLQNSDGTLTQEGTQYATVLPTDNQGSVTLVGSAGAHAKLQWTNPFAGWSTEAEFWRQPGGQGSYVYNNTNYVSPGGTQTPANAYTSGDRIEGRVRYYNRLGAGPWSAFSNTVLMH
jgi:hypothetical protein